ncbi:MAG: hypothetical protein R3F41_13380 [Gammaproteobacteria bacterium]|nr:hypothetical protein [Pseudomonadales bacterium]MCP5349092.1 hypothetical protein [Pseudomonadales bacterium]
MKSTTILAIVFALTGSMASPGPEDSYNVPRTEFDFPDLQGVWNFSSNTLMERPERFGNQEFLEAEQLEQERKRIAEFHAAAEARAARLVVNPSAPRPGDSVGSRNDFWNEGAGIGKNSRTSLIVYPENGRFPAPAQGAERQFDNLSRDMPGTRPVRTLVGGIGKDGPEDRGLAERCIAGVNSGPPFTPSLYNNNLQLVQGRDTVVILMEMVHDARIVSIVDKPDLPDNIRLWSGDSRGWYENNDTLIVVTKNFNGLRQPINYSGVGSNYDTVLTERFTRTGYNSMEYQFTVSAPSAFSGKVSAIIPLTKVAGRIYEYACHEGNYSMTNLLRGARIAEQKVTGSEQHIIQ